MPVIRDAFALPLQGSLCRRVSRLRPRRRRRRSQPGRAGALRARAREWLRAEVTLWTRALDGGPQADRLLVRNRLTHLWADPDLAGLFDRDALDKLPPAERQECRALWAEVDSLIGRAQALNVDQE